MATVNSAAFVRRLLELAADVPLEHGSRATYTVIALHADVASGEAWPSWSTLTRLSGYGRATVWRGVAELEAAGLLTVTRRPGRANVYRFPLRGPLSTSGRVHATGPGGAGGRVDATYPSRGRDGTRRVGATRRTKEEPMKDAPTGARWLHDPLCECRPCRAERRTG